MPALNGAGVCLCGRLSSPDAAGGGICAKNPARTAPHILPAMISMIASVADGGAIGRNGALLVRISSDMERFRLLTLGSAVVMGRRTFASIGRALPCRRNIVVSSSMRGGGGAEWAADLDNALCLCRNADVFVIGGASIYRQAMPAAERMHITRIYAEFEADAFFPRIDSAEWRETSRMPAGRTADGCPFDFDFITYQRITNNNLL